MASSSVLIPWYVTHRSTLYLAYRVIYVIRCSQATSFGHVNVNDL